MLTLLQKFVMPLVDDKSPPAAVLEVKLVKPVYCFPRKDMGPSPEQTQSVRKIISERQTVFPFLRDPGLFF